MKKREKVFLKLGVEYLGMTCTVITLMLDGLCNKHKLRIKL